MITADTLIQAFDLPPQTRVDLRIPKTQLTEHGAPTAADKRAINDGVERIQWLATLKPATAAIAAYSDSQCEYAELAILHAELRPKAKAPRIVELLHRAIPYPVVALISQGEALSIAWAHKRRSQAETSAVVLDGAVGQVDLLPDDEPYLEQLLAHLALAKQPRQHLRATYQGWIDTLLALPAARRTGRFALAASQTERHTRRQALDECQRIETELARLRKQASKEKQMARRVQLNLECQRLQAAYSQAQGML